MPIHNSDIVENFNKVADLLEISDANLFRVRAYRNAARTIGSLAKSVADLIAEDKPLTDFSGIGKDLGVKIAVSTDAHSIDSLDHMRLGVLQARRGWLEPDDVLNTRSWKELKKLFKKS